MTNRRGGLSCTASPSIPAGTDLRALTSRSGAARGWPREGRTVARHVENDNPELAGVERGAAGGPARTGCWARARRRADGARSRRRRPGAAGAPARWGRARFGGLQQGAHLCVAVARPADRVAVEVQSAVHFRHVDPALDPAGERLDRAGRIVPVTPTSTAKWWRVPAWTHERKVMHSGCCGRHRERPVTASHPPAHRRRSSRRPGSARGRGRCVYAARRPGETIVA